MIHDLELERAQDKLTRAEKESAAHATKYRAQTELIAELVASLSSDVRPIRSLILSYCI